MMEYSFLVLKGGFQAEKHYLEKFSTLKHALKQFKAIN
jgi:hypothetical protein